MMQKMSVVEQSNLSIGRNRGTKTEQRSGSAAARKGIMII